MAKTNYVKKLSVATIGAIPKEFKKQPHDTRVSLMQVIGRVEKIETGTSQFGEWVAFVGSFKAVKMEDGEVFRGAKCLLPDVAASMLTEAVEKAGDGIVEFAIEIGLRRVVKFDAKGEETGIGYEYTMKPLIEMDAASDPLAALEARAGLKSLPAPDLVEQAETGPEETEPEETPAPKRKK